MTIDDTFICNIARDFGRIKCHGICIPRNSSVVYYTHGGRITSFLCTLCGDIHFKKLKD